MNITLSDADVRLAYELEEARSAKAVAVGAGDKTYVSGTKHGPSGGRDNILGLIGLSRALNLPIDPDVCIDYNDKRRGIKLPTLASGKTFVPAVTSHVRGALLRNSTGTDLHADYYMLCVKHSDTDFTYIGYATHDELYSRCEDYLYMRKMHFRTQEELHPEIPV